MPRWYWWVAGVVAVRTVWDAVSGAAAAALGVSLLCGFWTYRLFAATAAGESRWRAAWREVRRIAAEVGDAALGWLLVLLVILGIAGIAVTWPPSWGLVAIVVVVAIVAVVALIASIAGVATLVDRVRGRRWTARRDALRPVLATWERHSLSLEAADRELVELIIKAAYARRRGLGQPDVQWASSPPEFARLLREARDRPRLHGPPPSWFSLLRIDAGWHTWSTIWNIVADEPPWAELEGALAAGAGTAGLDRLVEHASWFSFRTGLAIVLERASELHLNVFGALHRVDGPAVRFPDSWAVYALDGVPVPAAAVEDPESFDPREALTHENVEVRRVLLDHLGWDRIVTGSGLTPQAEDDHGRLWQLPTADEEPLLLLEVENATPEEDGHHRRYFLRVPPDMRTPREATAWTFGLSELEYAPDAES